MVWILNTSHFLQNYSKKQDGSKKAILFPSVSLTPDVIILFVSVTEADGGADLVSLIAVPAAAQ